LQSWSHGRTGFQGRNRCNGKATHNLEDQRRDQEKKKQQKAKEMFHKLPFAVMEPWKKRVSRQEQMQWKNNT
jgi:hypothetical protein